MAGAKRDLEDFGGRAKSRFNDAFKDASENDFRDRPENQRYWDYLKSMVGAGGESAKDAADLPRLRSSSGENSVRNLNYRGLDDNLNVALERGNRGNRSDRNDRSSEASSWSSSLWGNGNNNSNGKGNGNGDGENGDGYRKGKSDFMKEETKQGRRLAEDAGSMLGTANANLKKHADKTLETARPLATLLHDRGFRARVLRSAAVGGVCAYAPALLLVPIRGARRGVGFFGMGLGVGWTLRQMCAEAEAIL